MPTDPVLHSRSACPSDVFLKTFPPPPPPHHHHHHHREYNDMNDLMVWRMLILPYVFALAIDNFIILY